MAVYPGLPSIPCITIRTAVVARILPNLCCISTKARFVTKCFDGLTLYRKRVTYSQVRSFRVRSCSTARQFSVGDKKGKANASIGDGDFLVGRRRRVEPLTQSACQCKYVDTVWFMLMLLLYLSSASSVINCNDASRHRLTKITTLSHLGSGGSSNSSVSSSGPPNISSEEAMATLVVWRARRSR